MASVAAATPPSGSSVASRARTQEQTWLPSSPPDNSDGARSQILKTPPRTHKFSLTPAVYHYRNGKGPGPAGEYQTPLLKYSECDSYSRVIGKAFKSGFACGFLGVAGFTVQVARRKESVAMVGSAALVTGLWGGFAYGIGAGVFRGMEYKLERLRGVRDIWNVTVAAGLGFAAFDVLLIGRITSYARHLPIMRFGRRSPAIAVGAILGGLSYVLERAFYELTPTSQGSHSGATDKSYLLPMLDANEELHDYGEYKERDVEFY